jgi:hypothetical protein
MGLVVPVSGPYVGVINAFPFGTLSDDGYELLCTIQGQEVNESDAYGMTLVEAVYRGQNWRLRIRGLEWKSGLLATLQGFGSQVPLVSGVLAPTLANIGDLFTRYPGVLVLTAILGSPPTVPQTLTSQSTTVAPQQQSNFMMTSKVRELPLEMVLFPYHTTVGSLSYNVPFTVT